MLHYDCIVTICTLEESYWIVGAVEQNFEMEVPRVKLGSQGLEVKFTFTFLSSRTLSLIVCLCSSRNRTFLGIYEFDFCYR